MKESTEMSGALSERERRAAKNLVSEIQRYLLDSDESAYDYSARTPDPDVTERVLANVARRLKREWWKVDRPDRGPHGLGLIVRRPKT
jgi:hypothetical protein